MNKFTQKHYSAPEVKILFIRANQLCAGSQTVTESATHDNYETVDLFD